MIHINYKDAYNFLSEQGFEINSLVDNVIGMFENYHLARNFELVRQDNENYLMKRD
jgi:hypothetical protein